MSKIWREDINGINEFCGQYKCDSCGKIVYEAETVKSMDFCAKCYQETFGITEKDQKIIDLEAKLAESEKFMKANGFKNWKEAQDALNGKFECIFDEKQELWKKLVAENAQLKQELKEEEKHIIGQNALLNKSKENNNQLKQQLVEKDAEIQSWKDGTMVVKLGKLEEQLAEKEQELNDICHNYDFQINDFSREVHRLKEREKVLEQQLAESERKYEDRKQFCITETRSLTEIINNLLEENTHLNNQLFDKDKEIERLKQDKEHLNYHLIDKNCECELLKPEQNQTAIEKLESVNNLLKGFSMLQKTNSLIHFCQEYLEETYEIVDYIDQQIKELKGGK